MIDRYSNNPEFSLSNPTATSIAMGAVAVSFEGLTAHYNSRIFTIPAPSVPTWYYVTIADPTQEGEVSTSALLATCQNSDDLVGIEGHVFIGAIEALPSGRSINQLAGGWPALQTWIVMD
jgi:hypothetical protein